MDITYRHLRKNVKNNLNMGIASAVCLNFTVPFFAVIAAKFGATNTDYALLNSVPALMTILATLPASAIITRFRYQKRIAVGIMITSRLSFLLMALLPFFHFQKVQALILLVGLYTATTAIAGISWQSILGEIIPVQYRNKVFAQRNVWASITGMIVVLIAGWYIDRYSFPHGYQTAFLLGTVGGLLECWYFLRFKVPSEDPTDNNLTEKVVLLEDNVVEEVNDANLIDAISTKELQTVKVPIAHAKAHSSLNPFKRIINTFKFAAGPEYYLFCIAAVIFTFAWMAAWPVFTKIKVDILHATNMQISIDTVASAIGSLLGFRLWARIIERKGNAFTLFLSALAIGSNPLMWLFSSSMNAVYFIDMFGAFVTAGYTLSMFNRQLEIVPAISRQKSIAFYTSLSQISAIIAPIVGMQLYERLSFEGTMWASSFVRVFGALCFLAILHPAIQRRFAQKNRQRA
ncbi:MAG: MFS transporter [Gorillibacterium sp.]|nr:MFS transporter [Gorillibacterium sp.]